MGRYYGVLGVKTTYIRSLDSLQGGSKMESSTLRADDNTHFLRGLGIFPTSVRCA